MKQIRFILSFVLFSIITLFSSQGQNANSYKTEKDLLYRSGELTDYMQERCRLDLYYPDNKPGYTTVIWFHGGGITGGEKFIPEQWKNKGIAVVAVNYRLGPTVKCPEYIEDAAAAVAWVFNHIEEFGGAKERIVISGHSAGGYLGSMVVMDKRYLAAYQLDADRVVALIPFSGHTITHFLIRSERGMAGTQPLIDEFAPLYFVRPDAPPLYLITGDRELEMLGRYEENAYMYRMMKVAGHRETHLFELDGFDHGGMAVPGFDLALRILKKLKLN